MDGRRLVGSGMNAWDPGRPVPDRNVVYDPNTRIQGYAYYEVGRILRILMERCTIDRVRDLCEEALTRAPQLEPLQLRNEYLLPIRVALQGWKEGYTLAVMMKQMLSALLDDSVEGGPYDYNRISLRTIIGYDPSKQIEGGRLMN